MATKNSKPEVVLVNTTVKELHSVLEICNVIEQEITEKDAKLRTREGIALRGFIRKIVQPALENYQSRIQTANTRFCKLDSDGCIIYDDKDRLKYTPENDVKRREAIEKAKNDAVTVEKYRISEINELPKRLLADNEIELLNKFVYFAE